MQIGDACLLMLALRPVIEPKAQRARHAGAAIVCGAAAKADDDFLSAPFHRIQHHLTDAERGCTNRIAFAF